MSISLHRLTVLAGTVESFATELKELVALRARVARATTRRPKIAARRRIRSCARSEVGQSRI
jgi:hypothetical protein